MANSRFKGIFMAIPAIGCSLLFVVILMIIIRIWLVGSPKYTRKHLRYPNRFNYPNPDEELPPKPKYYPAPTYNMYNTYPLRSPPPSQTATMYSYPVKPKATYNPQPPAAYSNQGFHPANKEDAYRTM